MSFSEAAGGGQRELTPPQRLEMVFEKKSADLAAVMPNVPHLKAGRLAQLVIDEYKRPGSSIARCSPDSVFLAARDSIAAGLDPVTKTLGEAWLVPYKGQASFQIGYKGYLKLAQNSRRVARMVARAVYEDELGDFECDEVAGHLVHPRDLSKKINRSPEKLVGAYCAVWLIHPRDKGEAPVVSDLPVIKLLDRDQIMARRARNPAVKKGKRSPWDTDFEPMAVKCAVRAMHSSGMIPMSTDMAMAVGKDVESSGEYYDEDPEATAGNVMGVEVDGQTITGPDGKVHDVKDANFVEQGQDPEKFKDIKVDDMVADEGPVTGHAEEDW